MAYSEQHEYVLYLNNPVAMRVIPGAAATFFLGLPVYLALTTGFANTRAFWSLEALLAPGAVFMLWLAFPREHTKAHLSVRHDSIAVTPSRSDRRFWGEQAVQIPVAPNSVEILLCRRIYEGMPNGHRLIVRDNDETERELTVKFWTPPDAQECRIIAGNIAAVTGLPVRLIVRRSVNGRVEETNWLPPEPGELTGKGLALTAIVALPFIGGIITGHLRPQPAVSISVGFLLWLLQFGASAAWARQFPAQTHRYWLYLLPSIFRFGTAYGMAYVMVAFVLHAG